MFWTSLIFWEITRNLPDWIFTFISANIYWRLSMFRQPSWHWGCSSKQDCPKTLPCCNLHLGWDWKEITYNKINTYNKISGKNEAMRKINQDKQIENDWKTFTEHSIQHITINWHWLVWFMDVHHFLSHMMLMILAILLSTFMDVAFKETATCSKQRVSLVKPSFLTAHTKAGPVTVADFPSLKGCSIPWIKMSHPCHMPCAMSAHWQHPSFITNGSPWVSCQHFRMGFSVNASVEVFFTHLITKQLLQSPEHPSSASVQPGKEAHMALFAHWLLSRAAGKG